MTIQAGQLRLLPSDRESGPRYGSLLVILVVTYLLSALTQGSLVSAVQVLLFLAVVLIALRNGRLHRRTVQVLAVGLMLGSAAAAILQLDDRNGDGGALASLWTAMILLLAVVFIVRQVLSQPEITEQSIFGALSAYMMIGLIFAAVYAAMQKFNAQPFFAHGVSGISKTFQYFSFSTLTTLGYGDFTAVGDAGRAVAVLEAMVGQMFLATLVARLVAGFRWSDRATARRGGRQAAGAVSPGQSTSSPPSPSLPRPGAAFPPGAGEPYPGQPGPGEPGLGLPHPSSVTGIGHRDPGEPGSGPPGAGRSGPSRAKKASAPGLIRLNPPGAVRGRASGLRPGGRNRAGGAGPAPADRH